MSTASRRLTPERLVKRYFALPDRDRGILQILSIAYHPISRNALAACAKAAGFRPDRGGQFTPTLLKPLLDRWIELGLVESSKLGVQCHRAIVECVTGEAFDDGRFDEFVTVSDRHAPSTNPALDAFDVAARYVRIGLYSGDPARLERAFSFNIFQGVDPKDVFQKLCFEPFDRDAFTRLAPEIAGQILETVLLDAILDLDLQIELLEFLEERCENDDRYRRAPRAWSVLYEQYLCQGRLGEARACLQQMEALGAPGVGLSQGWLAFMEGDSDAAIAKYRRTLAEILEEPVLRPGAKLSRQPTIDSFEGLILTLALLREGSPEALRQARQQASSIVGQRMMFAQGYAVLSMAIDVQLGNLEMKERLFGCPVLGYRQWSSVETFLAVLSLYWVDREAAKKHAERFLQPLATAALKAGYEWLGLEATALLAELSDDEMFGELLETIRDVSELKQFVPAVQYLRPKSAWELQLAALQSLQGDAPTDGKKPEQKRMAWAIELRDNEVSLEPREQKLSTKGGWTRGRAVALKRLYRDADKFDYLTGRDRRVCERIEREYSYSYYGSDSTYWIASSAILDLVGHPNVFWSKSPNISVEIVAGQPQLAVRYEKDGQLAISLVPSFAGDDEVVVTRESMTRLSVFEITDKHRNIASIFGGEATIRVPAHAQEQVLAAIEAVAGNIVIQSDIGGVANIDSVPSDATPHVHLLPASPGLRVSMLVRPFATGGPYYLPSRGGETAIAAIDERQVQTQRDLKAEAALAGTTIAACPTLERLPAEDSGYEWQIGEPIDCLELIAELQDMRSAVEAIESGDTESLLALELLDKLPDREDPIVAPIVEWPEGEKFHISRRLGLTDMKMSVGRQRDWFAVEGELRVDEQTVFDLQQLLRLLDASPGRFVQLGDGQFAALTKEFRKQLEDLRGIGEERGKGVRLHPLASLAIEDTLSEIGELTADKAWKDHVKRVRTMREISPDVPEDLQAELRDYQIDGYRWLMQLAHWGVGACLADDMGLGKTLQSLALILARAEAGPTLAIAPTSVGMNWLSEVAKFAPSLNPIWLGSAGDRQAALENLQPRDLVVCSYGLLQQGEVGELLAGVEWTTAILDEAQAIKNSATQRSKAAMKLKADFRVILTGTPIENHLGELWNLFRFINPGLLGSQEKFQQRYANPIERGDDEDARRRLKTLIQPFVLRRTKARVLSELPSRTEITVPVELSAEEQSLYEATRRNSLEKLTQADDENAGAKHLRVLAEIMRLRRLCCNPKLVVADTPVGSAKLAAFGEILTELLDNDHKALVFSQFVDHLAIVRDYLDDRQIPYQYLDGSTAAKTRKKRVDAFQAGEGDVFLISLKAGGTGLNLTAADYVIHLDPWWNPAVEDQASDRAHRIGQQRPVTIYRLVSQGTIEEKIVDLHRQKRDLADSLLDGTDVAGKLSADALLELIVS
ncbi:MAG: DEAD/DEAH box helicase [Geitlerinemataceae cyanobacterium]